MKRYTIDPRAKALARYINSFCTDHWRRNMICAYSTQKKTKVLAKLLMLMCELYAVDPKLCRRIPLNNIGWIPFFGKRLSEINTFYIATYDRQLK